MASIHRETTIAAAAAEVWSAIRDVGAIHTRLARGFVLDTRLDGNSRLVTFADGAIVRERIVTVDDEGRRLAYAVVEGKLTHHNASLQVFPEGVLRSRLVWVADLLPDSLAEAIGGVMARGMAAMKDTLEAG